MGQRPPEPSRIRLGLMPPLSGIVSLYGEEISQAATIACAEINETGGVLGRPIELLIEDDGSLPQTAVPAAERLVQAGCVAIVGNLLSNSRLAVATHVADRYGLPYLNFSFYEGSISSRWFFHFAALPNQQIDRMIPWMAEKFGPKMFFAGSNYEWPRGSVDAAKRALRALDGELVGESYLPIGSTAIDELLGEVALSGADVFVPYFAGTDQVNLLTKFTARGLKNHMAVVMGHYDEAMARALPAEVRTGFFSSNTYFMSVDTTANRSYLKRLEALTSVTGIFPRGNGILTNFGEGTYVAVRAFAEAANRAGTVAPEELREALKTVNVTGPQGRVRMDPGTQHATVNTCLARCLADGTFAIVEHFGEIAPQIPDRYRPAVPAKHPTNHDSGPALGIEGRAPPARPPLSGGAGPMALPIAPERVSERILEVADIAVVATNPHGTILQVNQTACQLFGYGAAELLGMSVHLLVPPSARSAHALSAERFLAGDQLESPMGRRGSIAGYRKDGSQFPAEATLRRIESADGPLVVTTLRDISQQQQLEEELVWRATHDPLTRLPNRALVRERISKALHRAERSGQGVALMYIDLDGFKAINDRHGHALGDRYLVAITDRMVDRVRAGDTVARLAGDEFVVLCEQVEDLAGIAAGAERMTDALREAIVLDGVRFSPTASIGVAFGHKATHSADDLLRNADAAMYHVKERGRDGWQLYSEDLEETARQRLQIALGLRTALQDDELSVRMQPLISVATRAIQGAEVLLRWHPAGGEISPATFIPIAEMTGAIAPIGRWVFEQACRLEVASRRRAGPMAPYLSVNLSARQLESDRRARTVTAAIVGLGRALDLTVVAEGVETEQQLAVLLELGCDQAQGFLLHRPMREESYWELLGHAP